MTVEELIEQLSKCDPTSDVISINGGCCGCASVAEGFFVTAPYTETDKRVFVGVWE